MEIPVNDPDGLSERKQQERRQHPRTKVKVAIEVQSERTATPLRVQTADLSIGGLYVEMMFTREVGTKLKIVLWLNDVQVSTCGVVVTRDLHVGNGIKFTDMAPEDRERLKHFLTADAASNPPQGEAEGQRPNRSRCAVT
jgi:c-di-GMP-binding flagellar brake protein YcgR